MKLPKYKEALTMGKETLNTILATARNMKARKQAELEMAKLDEQIATKQAKIQEICTDSDINFNHVIELLDDLALVERKKKQYQKILNEMFGPNDNEDIGQETAS